MNLELQKAEVVALSAIYDNAFLLISPSSLEMLEAKTELPHEPIECQVEIALEKNKPLENSVRFGIRFTLPSDYPVLSAPFATVHLLLPVSYDMTRSDPAIVRQLLHPTERELALVLRRRHGLLPPPGTPNDDPLPEGEPPPPGPSGGEMLFDALQTVVSLCGEVKAGEPGDSLPALRLLLAQVRLLK